MLKIKSNKNDNHITMTKWNENWNYKTKVNSKYKK